MTNQTIGFIGTGMIATAMIQGFCERSDRAKKIIVSNRTVSKAKEIAETYPQKVEYVESFQECVDKSDIVVIAVLPNVASEVIKSLEFKPEHRIVSVVFTMAKEEIEPLLNCKVKSVTHMIPGTFVSVIKGPIITYPSDKVVEDIFSDIGTVVVVDKRDVEKTMISLTGMFAPIFSVEDTLIKWCVNHGVPEDAAFSYTSQLFYALAYEAANEDAAGVHRLATVNTEGGINMQAVEQITKEGGFEAFSNALDALFCRING